MPSNPLPDQSDLARTLNAARNALIAGRTALACGEPLSNDLREHLSRAITRCEESIVGIATPMINDKAVESVMLNLMGAQVEVIQRFNQPLRDQYLDQLRDYVRGVLVRAASANTLTPDEERQS